MSGWIGVDLDGTLAEYHGWRGAWHIGDPVPLMLQRVRRWLRDGEDVRIFTARVDDSNQEQAATAMVAIRGWCLRWLGQELPVTNRKDLSMIVLWDDRTVQVEPNTGKRADGLL